jgi:hypothetical protein
VREAARSPPDRVVWRHCFPDQSGSSWWTSRLRICEFYFGRLEFVSSAAEGLSGINSNRISDENKHGETSAAAVIIKCRLMLKIVIDRLYIVFNVKVSGRAGWSRGNPLFVFRRWSLRGTRTRPFLAIRRSPQAKVHHSPAISSSDAMWIRY